MAAPEQLCTLRLGDALFGVDVLRVQEVIRAQPMTGVPRAADVVRGLINLRGQIVTAVDLRTRLMLPPRPDGAPPMNVVVRTEDGPVSLLVDEIGDVIEVGEAEISPAPETLHPAIASAIAGVVKLPERLLLLLDADRVIEVDAALGHNDTARARDHVVDTARDHVVDAA